MSLAKETLPMCDYSLHQQETRDAVAGDDLILTRFRGTATKGFAAKEKRTVAVCMRIGTELAFDEEVTYDRRFFCLAEHAGYNVGKLVKLNPRAADQHQDAIEFPNGERISLQRLCAGQKVTVLQLPPAQKPPALPGSETAIVDRRQPAQV